MRYLLDTNVVSEFSKPKSDANVFATIGRLPEDDIFVSVVTIAEVERGLALMQPGRRRSELRDWLDHALLPRLGRRLLPVDRAVSGAWGKLMAESSKRGVNMGILDAFIAATALTQDLTVMTRNVRHFAWCGVPLSDPWVGP